MIKERCSGLCEEIMRGMRMTVPRSQITEWVRFVNFLIAHQVTALLCQLISERIGLICRIDPIRLMAVMGQKGEEVRCINTERSERIERAE